MDPRLCPLQNEQPSTPIRDSPSQPRDVVSGLYCHVEARPCHDWPLVLRDQIRQEQIHEPGHVRLTRRSNERDTRTHVISAAKILHIHKVAKERSDRTDGENIDSIRSVGRLKHCKNLFKSL